MAYDIKQWAPYHYIASLGDGTADADGWLKMTVQTHSKSRAHLKRVSPCPFLWWPVAQTAVSLWFSSTGSLFPGLTLPLFRTITYLTRWKERGTIRCISELVRNLASALALRAPMMMRSQYRIELAIGGGQCGFNVRLASKTAAQHWNGIGWMPRACWGVNMSVLGKHKTLEQFFLNVGVSSATLAQHQTTLGQHIVVSGRCNSGSDPASPDVGAMLA